VTVDARGPRCGCIGPSRIEPGCSARSGSPRRIVTITAWDRRHDPLGHQASPRWIVVIGTSGHGVRCLGLLPSTHGDRGIRASRIRDRAMGARSHEEHLLGERTWRIGPLCCRPRRSDHRARGVTGPVSGHVHVTALNSTDPCDAPCRSRSRGPRCSCRGEGRCSSRESGSHQQGDTRGVGTHVHRPVQGSPPVHYAVS